MHHADGKRHDLVSGTPEMRLWMICPEHTVEALRTMGTLYSDPRHSSLAEDPPRPYAWMREAMRRRLPGYRGPSIWWAWHTLDGVIGKRPDLRDRARWHWNRPGSRWARLELEVPDAEVLLSDFMLWNVILNNGHLCHTEEEDARWDAAHPEHSTTYDAATRAAHEASWERVLTTEQGAFDPAWVGVIGENVQACFEALRWRDVRAVTRFTSRPVDEPHKR